ncbi:hypothetical protein [Paenibacillus terrigena]|nr:hypothetical protein [Paenibacillus terrigena]
MILSELWQLYEANKRIQGFSPSTLNIKSENKKRHSSSANGDT